MNYAKDESVVAADASCSGHSRHPGSKLDISNIVFFQGSKSEPIFGNISFTNLNFSDQRLTLSNK